MPKKERPNLTVISHFYNSYERVAMLVNDYHELNNVFGADIEFILVDDHSHEHYDTSIFSDIDRLSVYRISDDLPWNMAAARNIGALEATGRVILLHDIDHRPIVENFSIVMDRAKSLEPCERILFRRRLRSESEQDRESELHPHLNSFMMLRSQYFSVGGYDELFAGQYGKEDVYFQWCCRKNGFDEHVLDEKVTFTTEKRAINYDLSRNTLRNKALIEYFMSQHQYKAQVKYIVRWSQIV